ncbi:methyl-accepting chemotaxis protein [Pectobacterium actinidiae]|uniref:methyl-accepting chemotaxis protein n=1 Tax=Pectobacterium actinidiae TaxID=1507808 RepID=UPI001198C214|nr:methyl-accepting chemotaxis protein [Pectobacterium actinidiae]MDY4316608.1 methyl-accepting chemotaxis protein [Pectobacterium actinidiae]QDX96168.1 methyl-accepting chemotaxis protein [Pectobacterium carotovorum subsp. carotovorum]WEF11749.1 methyl-accepting chemotaxis protein [Pectobacterium actinidiae]GKW17671.1 methyl-accepting chemotaxis protein [Pectobacterium carotovorum subsp. carotovorum]
MNMLNRIKLGKMLGMGFSLVIIISLMVAFFGRLQLVGLGNDINRLSGTTLANMLLIQEVKAGFDANARLIRNIAISTDPEQIRQEKQFVDEQIARNTANLKKLGQQLDTEGTSALLKQFQDTRPPYLAAFLKAIALVQSTDPEQRLQGNAIILNEMQPAQNALFKVLDAMMASQQQDTNEIVSHAQRGAQSGSVIMLILALSAAVMAAVVAWLITRTLKNQLGGEPLYATHVARQVADGDLAVDIVLKPNDHNSLLATMRHMSNNLGDIVEQVRQSSEAIASGSSQIAAGSENLSQRTEEQAASLQQTAASMEQMSQAIRQNAHTVRSVTQLASQASETATKGGDAISNMVITMKEISASSHKIRDIISVIDGIAFQTNILALNAAVEAARAGEQGRGFAVVAGEVRSLAQRSASAAKEIAVLINTSVEKVEAGNRLVEDTGSTIDELVRQARSVAELISEIGTTTQEQESGISQIHDAVNQLDQVTHQNATLVEESANAATSLREQSSHLVTLMNHFHLRGTPAAHPAPMAKKTQPTRLALAPVSNAQDNWEKF